MLFKQAYFIPTINNLISDSHKGEFLSSQSSREAAVQSLLGWILDDDDDDKTAARHFTAALKQLNSETGNTIKCNAVVTVFISMNRDVTNII